MKPISKQWRDCSRACALLVLVTLVACQPVKTANSDLHTIKFASPTTLKKIPDVETISGLVMLAEAKLASDDAKTAVSLYLEAANQINLT